LTKNGEFFHLSRKKSCPTLSPYHLDFLTLLSIYHSMHSAVQAHKTVERQEYMLLQKKKCESTDFLHGKPPLEKGPCPGVLTFP
jgi:hypothetical protein